MQGTAGNKLKIALLTTAIVLGVSACTNVAMTGAQAAYNHKKLQNNIKDQYISMQAIHVLNRPMFSNANIDIATVNGEVLMVGQAPEEWQKQRAGDFINNIDGVKQVYNLVSISAPSSTLTRISDAWITAKVKGKLIASNDLDATRIKVVTERGTVFLMGIVKPEEAGAAIDIASTTQGVTSVVKMFSYMKITKQL